MTFDITVACFCKSTEIAPRMAYDEHVCFSKAIASSVCGHKTVTSKVATVEVGKCRAFSSPAASVIEILNYKQVVFLALLFFSQSFLHQSVEFTSRNISLFCTATAAYISIYLGVVTPTIELLLVHDFIPGLAPRQQHTTKCLARTSYQHRSQARRSGLKTAANMRAYNYSLSSRLQFYLKKTYQIHRLPRQVIKSPMPRIKSHRSPSTTELLKQINFKGLATRRLLLFLHRHHARGGLSKCRSPTPQSR